jgi:hypothetical protein
MDTFVQNRRADVSERMLATFDVSMVAEAELPTGPVAVSFWLRASWRAAKKAFEQGRVVVLSVESWESPEMVAMVAADRCKVDLAARHDANRGRLYLRKREAVALEGEAAGLSGEADSRDDVAVDDAEAVDVDGSVATCDADDEGDGDFDDDAREGRGDETTIEADRAAILAKVFSFIDNLPDCRLATCMTMLDTLIGGSCGAIAKVSASKSTVKDRIASLPAHELPRVLPRFVRWAAKFTGHIEGGRPDRRPTTKHAAKAVTMSRLALVNEVRALIQHLQDSVLSTYIDMYGAVLNREFPGGDCRDRRVKILQEIVAFLTEPQLIEARRAFWERLGIR